MSYPIIQYPWGHGVTTRSKGYDQVKGSMNDDKITALFGILRHHWYGIAIDWLFML